MNSTTKIPTWTRGDRLKKARTEAGLSQHEMADQLDVSRATVGRWENDETAPHWLFVERWAQIVAVPVWWLAGEDPAGGAAGSSTPSVRQVDCSGTVTPFPARRVPARPPFVEIIAA